MKLIFSVLTLVTAIVLAACGTPENSVVEVKGGTTNTVEVTNMTVRIQTLDTGFCVGSFFGDTINEGACVLDSNPPALDVYNIKGLAATRDSVLYPYTADELLFLGQ